MPPTQTVYIHRVGRTARAGSAGRAVSLITDSATDRKLLKEIVRHAQRTNVCKHRVVPNDVISEFREKIDSLQDDIQEILNQEHEEAMVLFF
jgi:ATP-dependent RNA helicase DDX27